MLKIKDPQAFDLLNKLSTASGTKQFDWTKLPTNSQWSSIKSLESLELIFTRDFSEYVLINGKTKEIMTRVEKA